MKKRHGFVSNSSSSSFVIAPKFSSKQDTVKIQMEVKLDDIIDGSEMPKIEVPEEENDRIQELAALIGMMMIDGKIYEEEFQLCSLVAMKFGFQPEIVNDIITDILKKS